LAQQLANTQAQVLEMQRRTADADLATLDALDPAEQVVRLKARVQRMDAERAADQERQLYTNQAYQLAAKAGISLEDPRLAGVGSATPQGVMQLASRIAELVREDAEARVQAARVSTVSRAADTQVAAQRAAQDALKDAGVAQTSGQPGSVSAGLADEERAKRIAAFTARKRAMAGKGTDNPAYARLLADVIGAGLKMADLG
jgi:nucleotide-binding universal stress UspA family protein